MEDLSTPQLMSRLSQETSELVSAEVRLAKAELQESIRHAGLGAGLFGTAGVLTAYALAALVASAILAVALVWPAWLAALAVAGGLLVVVAVAAVVGRRQVRQAPPPLRESASSVHEDLQTVKEARRG